MEVQVYVPVSFMVAFLISKFPLPSFLNLESRRFWVPEKKKDTCMCSWIHIISGEVQFMSQTRLSSSGMNGNLRVPHVWLDYVHPFTSTVAWYQPMNALSYNFDSCNINFQTRLVYSARRSPWCTKISLEFCCIYFIYLTTKIQTVTGFVFVFLYWSKGGHLFCCCCFITKIWRLSHFPCACTCMPCRSALWQCMYFLHCLI